MLFNYDDKDFEVKQVIAWRIILKRIATPGWSPSMIRCDGARGGRFRFDWRSGQAD